MLKPVGGLETGRFQSCFFCSFYGAEDEEVDDLDEDERGVL